MKGLLSLLIIVLLFLTDTEILEAGEPPKEPILKIETGMHTAPIRKIGIDGENRYLVTGSDDKTIRVWELKTGRLLKILRPPIGEGNEGKIYAVAISPDRRLIAGGGWTGKWDETFSIYIFEQDSGRLIKRIQGLPNVILHLTFSKDGRYLVACLGKVSGIRVYETGGFTLIKEDKDYGDSSYGADFSKDGRLVTTSFDGYIRLYDRDFKLIKKKKGRGGKEPYSISFSPDGKKIAVCYYYSTRVDVLSGDDLSYLYSPGTRGIDKGNLSAVTWSYDGGSLYAGGRHRSMSLDSLIIRRWLDKGRGRFIDLPAADNTITHILPLKDGGIVFGSGEPSFGIFDGGDRKVLFKTHEIADLRGMLDDFKVSYDGSVVRFGYEKRGGSPAIFSIKDKELRRGEEESALGSPITRYMGIEVKDWEDYYNPTLNSKPLSLERFEILSSLAISPDGKYTLFGTDWDLCLSRDGKDRWCIPAPGVAWGVNISGDGRLAIGAFGDGTIRWYRLRDGKELLAFFPHKDKKRWVIWTPSGYYDASAGAEDLIGWHINNGKDVASDFFPVSRFRERFYRPDVIAKVFDTLDEGEAIRLASKESGRKVSEEKITRILPPVVTILSPHDGYEAKDKEITVRFSVHSPSGEPVTNIKALVDGRPVSSTRGVKIVSKDDVQEIKVVIPERDCEVSIIAENRYAVSEPTTVRIRWQGVKGEEFVIKPKLYILAIGVSNYQNMALRLKFAHKDAQDFVDVMLKQKGRLYRDIEVRLLTNEKASKDEILDGLEWLERQTTSKDVAMVFIAGHGVNDPNSIYYFLPVNAEIDRLKRTGIAFSDIKNTVSSIAGKVILFVDTCHSGNVMGGRRNLPDMNAFVNELISAEAGAVVFSSSTGRQYSIEDERWRNGAFTKALVEGLSGRADYTGKGKITINMLDLYLSERVKEITKGRQTPTTAKPNIVPDFPIAVR